MDTATQAKPTVGRVVHFVLNKGPNAGAHRPAMIVGVESDYTVDLQVFSNGTRGDMPKGDLSPNVFWVPKCVLDEEGSKGTWHWPERD